MKNGITEELLVFLTTLAELRHLGQTAQRLGISGPSASRLLAEARTVFRDDLFVRHGHGLTPTHRALLLAERAEHVLEGMRALTVDAVFAPAKLDRVFRGACLDNAFPMLVEPMLAAFHEAAPKAGLAFRTHSETTLGHLRAGDLDFALFPAANLPDEFEHMPLVKTPYVHLVRPGHPLEALLERGTDDWRAEAARYRRIQIVVHPDTDSTAEGTPGPAVIPVSTSGTTLWTESWMSAYYLMLKTDAVLTFPWRTAQNLATLLPVVVLGRASSVPSLEPSLIWHRRSSADPAFVWLRSLFWTYVRKGEKELVLDEIQTGRIGPQP